MKNYISPGSASVIREDPSIQQLLNETSASREAPVNYINGMSRNEATSHTNGRRFHAKGDVVEIGVEKMAEKKKGGRCMKSLREDKSFGDFVNGVGGFLKDYGPTIASFAPLLLKRGGSAKKTSRGRHAAGGAGKVRKGEYY